jgi:hypothetical protein
MSGFPNAVNSGKKSTSFRGSCIRERRSAELRRLQRERYAQRIFLLRERAGFEVVEHLILDAHWYSPATFERYMAAHIARDQEKGYRPRMVRDFIAELRGFAGTAKQKLALAENDASRTTLAEFFTSGEPAIAKLLASCKRHSEPVKPERLGLIGRDHLLADCILMGAAERSFRYRKHIDTLATSDQLLPYDLEVAFAWCPDGDQRQLIAGINFSIATNNPFYRLGVFENLEGALSRQYVQYDDPVILILHYTCPRVDFSDHGKGMLTLPAPVGRVAAKLVTAVTEDWAKQRRDEIRRDSAATRRRERLLQQRKRPEKKEPPAPSGTLAERITTAADSHGVSVDDLTVLSPNNDPYTAWRRLRDAECFARLFNRFVAPGAKRHLRGLFYRCVSSEDVIEWPNGKPLVNDRRNWLAFQKASKAARARACRVRAHYRRAQRRAQNLCAAARADHNWHIRWRRIRHPDRGRRCHATDFYLRFRRLADTSHHLLRRKNISG